MASQSIPIDENPNPSDVKAEDFVIVTLSRTNYSTWRSLMLKFIRSQHLIGFIDGTMMAPEEKINDDNASGGTIQVDNPSYLSWKSSDEIVRKWFQLTMEKEIYVEIMRSGTAYLMWRALARSFFQPFRIDHHIVTGGELAAQKKGINLSKYLPLYRAAQKGDWDRAKAIFDHDPNAISAPIDINFQTALHLAVRSEERNQFLQRLLEYIPTKDVAVLDLAEGMTALHKAAANANLGAAKLLVAKNPGLPNVWDRFEERLPLHVAAQRGNREMFNYLLLVTDLGAEPKVLDHKSASTLMHSLVIAGFYDIAVSLIQKHPDLALVDPSPLESLALQSCAFRSGTRPKNWHLWIYDYVPTKLENSYSSQCTGDIENPASGYSLVISLNLQAMLWKFASIFVPQIKYLSKKKLENHHALKLVECICEQLIVRFDHWEACSIVATPIRYAIYLGIHEMLEEIFYQLPGSLNLRVEKERTVFHNAIVYRHENVFNLIYQLSGKRTLILSEADDSGNNGLHLAASLSSQQLPNLRASAAGAALQMQRELQWFEEVKKFALPQDRDKRNTEGKTPADVFSDTHKELLKEGEQWMKDTASSCTIVAALVVTIVFAAAITVPGGNNGDTGLPVFSKRLDFVVFAISDALALFLSVSSTIMFLSILTSRYAEEDFLYTLPNRLIIGLTTLFLAILAMMVAFGATLHLVFAVRNTWVIIPVVALAGVPVGLFSFLQFPLLLDMIKSTYLSKIFGKQSDRIFH